MIALTWHGPEPDLDVHTIGTVTYEAGLQYNLDQVLRIMLSSDDVALAAFIVRTSQSF